MPMTTSRAVVAGVSLAVILACVCAAIIAVQGGDFGSVASALARAFPGGRDVTLEESKMPTSGAAPASVPLPPGNAPLSAPSRSVMEEEDPHAAEKEAWEAEGRHNDAAAKRMAEWNELAKQGALREALMEHQDAFERGEEVTVGNYTIHAIADPRRLETLPSFGSCTAISLNGRTASEVLTLNGLCGSSGPTMGAGLECYNLQTDTRNHAIRCPANWGGAEWDKWNIMRWDLHDMSSAEWTEAWTEGYLMSITPQNVIERCAGSVHTIVSNGIWVDNNLNGIIVRYPNLPSRGGIYGSCDLMHYIGMGAGSLSLEVGNGHPWQGGISGTHHYHFTRSPSWVPNHQHMSIRSQFYLQCSSTKWPLLHAVDNADRFHYTCDASEPKLVTGHSIQVEAKRCEKGYYQAGGNCHACPIGTYNPYRFKVLPQNMGATDPGGPCPNCLSCAGCVATPAGSGSCVADPNVCTVRLETNKCFIGGNCIPEGPHASTRLAQCLYCNPSQSTYTGYLNHIPTCPPVNAVTDNVLACQCQIDGVCYPDGAAHPTNPLCQYCNSAINIYGWTMRDNTCVAADGKCGCLNLSGASATCTPNGATHPASTNSMCQFCNNQLPLQWSTIAGTCVVDGVCGCPDTSYAGQCAPPGHRPNDCQNCAPAALATDYSFNHPSGCLDGNACGCQLTPLSGGASVCYADEVRHPGALQHCLKCDIHVAYDSWTPLAGSCNNGADTCGCHISGTCHLHGSMHPTYSQCQTCDVTTGYFGWTEVQAFSGSCSAGTQGGDGDFCTHTDQCQAVGADPYQCRGTPYACSVGVCERAHTEIVCDGNGGCDKSFRTGEECRAGLDECTRFVLCVDGNPACPPHEYIPDTLSEASVTIAGADAFSLHGLLYTRSLDVAAAVTGMSNLQCVPDAANGIPGPPRFSKLSVAPAALEFVESDCGATSASQYLRGSASEYETSDPGELPVLTGAVSAGLIAPGDGLTLIVEARGLLPNAEATYASAPTVPSQVQRRVCTPRVVYDPSAPTWNEATLFAHEVLPRAAQATASDGDVSYMCPAASCAGGDGANCRAVGTIRFGGVVELESAVKGYRATFEDVRAAAGGAGVDLEGSPGVVEPDTPSLGATLASATVYEASANVIDVVVSDESPLPDGLEARLCVRTINAVDLESERLCTNGAMWSCTPPSDPALTIVDAVLGLDPSLTEQHYYVGLRSAIDLDYTRGVAVHAPIVTTRFKVFVDADPSVDQNAVPVQVTDFDAATRPASGVFTLPLDTDTVDGTTLIVVVEEITAVSNTVVQSSVATPPHICDRSPAPMTGLAVSPLDGRFLAEESPFAASDPAYSANNAVLGVRYLPQLPADAHNTEPIIHECALLDVNGADGTADCAGLVSWRVCEPVASQDGVRLQTSVADRSAALVDGIQTRVCTRARNQASLVSAVVVSANTLTFDLSPPLVGNVTVGAVVAEAGASTGWRIVDDVITAAWDSSDAHSPLIRTEVAVGVLGGALDSHLPWTVLDTGATRFVQDLALATLLSHGGTYVFSVRVTNGARLSTTVSSTPFEVDLTDPLPCSVWDLHGDFNVSVLDRQDEDWRRSDATVDPDALRTLYVAFDAPATSFEDVSPIASVTVTPFHRVDGVKTAAGATVVVEFANLIDDRGFDVALFNPVSDHDAPGGAAGYWVELTLTAASTRTSVCATDGVRFTPTPPLLGTSVDVSLAPVASAAAPAPAPGWAGSGDYGAYELGSAVLPAASLFTDRDYASETAFLTAQFPVPTDVSGIRDLFVRIVVETDEADPTDTTPGPWAGTTARVRVPTDLLPPASVDRSAFVQEDGVGDGTRVEMTRAGAWTMVRVWPPTPLPSGRVYAVELHAVNYALLTSTSTSDGLTVLAERLGGGSLRVDPVVGGSLAQPGALPLLPVDARAAVPSDAPPLIVSWAMADWVSDSEEPPTQFRVCLTLDRLVPRPDLASGERSVPAEAVRAACNGSAANTSLVLPWRSVGLNASTHLVWPGGDGSHPLHTHLWSHDEVVERFTPDATRRPPAGAEPDPAWLRRFRVVVEGVGQVPGSAAYAVSGPIVLDATPPRARIGGAGVQLVQGRSARVSIMLRDAAAWDDESGVSECLFSAGTTPGGAQVAELVRLPACPSPAGGDLLLPNVFDEESTRTLLAEGARVWVRLTVRNGAGLVHTVSPANNAPVEAAGLRVRVAPPLARATPGVLGVVRSEHAPASSASGAAGASLSSTSRGRPLVLPVAQPWGMGDGLTIRAAVPRFDMDVLPSADGDTEPVTCRAWLVDAVGLQRRPGGADLGWADSAALETEPLTLGGQTSWPCGGSDAADVGAAVAAAATPPLDANATRAAVADVYVGVAELFLSWFAFPQWYSPVTLQVVTEACAGGARSDANGNALPLTLPTATEGGLCARVASDVVLVDGIAPFGPTHVHDGPTEAADLTLVGTDGAAWLQTPEGATDRLVLPGQAYGDADAVVAAGASDPVVAPFVAAAWALPPPLTAPPTAPLSPVERIQAVAIVLDTPWQAQPPLSPATAQGVCPTDFTESAAAADLADVRARGLAAAWSGSWATRAAEALADVVGRNASGTPLAATTSESEAVRGWLLATAPSLPAGSTAWVEPAIPLPTVTGASLASPFVAGESAGVVVTCVRQVSLGGLASPWSCSDGVAVVADELSLGGAAPQLLAAPFRFDGSRIVALPETEQPGRVDEVPVAGLAIQTHTEALAVALPPLQPGLGGLARVGLRVGTAEVPATGPQHVLDLVELPPLEDIPWCPLDAAGLASTEPRDPAPLFRGAFGLASEGELEAETSTEAVVACLWGARSAVAHAARATGDLVAAPSAGPHRSLLALAANLTAACPSATQPEHAMGWGLAAGPVLVLAGPGLVLRDGFDHVATLVAESRTGQAVAVASSLLRVDTTLPKARGDGASAAAVGVRAQGSAVGFDATPSIAPQPLARPTMGVSPVSSLDDFDDVDDVDDVDDDSAAGAEATCAMPWSPGAIELAWSPLVDLQSGLCHALVDVDVFWPNGSAALRRSLALAPPALPEGVRSLFDETDGGIPTASGRTARLETGRRLAALPPAVWEAWRGAGAPLTVQPAVNTVGGQWSLRVPLLPVVEEAAAARAAADAAVAQADAGAGANATDATVVGGETVVANNATQADLVRIAAERVAAALAAERAAANQLAELVGGSAQARVTEVSCAGRVSSRGSAWIRVAGAQGPRLNVSLPAAGALIPPPASWSAARRDAVARPWSQRSRAALETPCAAALLCVPAGTPASCPLAGHGLCLAASDSPAAQQACRTAVLQQQQAAATRSGAVAVSDLGPVADVNLAAFVPESAFRAAADALAWSTEQTASPERCVALVQSHPGAAALGLATLSHPESETPMAVVRAGVDAQGRPRVAPLIHVPSLGVSHGAVAFASAMAVDQLGRTSAARSALLGRCDVTPPFVNDADDLVYPVAPLLSPVAPLPILPPVRNTTADPLGPGNNSGNSTGNSTGNSAGNSTGNSTESGSGSSAGSNSTGTAGSNSTGTAGGNSTSTGTAGSNSTGSAGNETVAARRMQGAFFAAEPLFAGWEPVGATAGGESAQDYFRGSVLGGLSAAVSGRGGPGRSVGREVAARLNRRADCRSALWRSALPSSVEVWDGAVGGSGGSGFLVLDALQRPATVQWTSMAPAVAIGQSNVSDVLLASVSPFQDGESNVVLAAAGAVRALVHVVGGDKSQLGGEADPCGLRAAAGGVRLWVTAAQVDPAVGNVSEPVLPAPQMGVDQDGGFAPRLLAAAGSVPAETRRPLVSLGGSGSGARATSAQSEAAAAEGARRGVAGDAACSLDALSVLPAAEVAVSAADVAAAEDEVGSAAVAPGSVAVLFPWAVAVNAQGLSTVLVGAPLVATTPDTAEGAGVVLSEDGPGSVSARVRHASPDAETPRSAAPAWLTSHADVLDCSLPTVEDDLSPIVGYEVALAAVVDAAAAEAAGLADTAASLGPTEQAGVVALQVAAAVLAPPLSPAVAVAGGENATNGSVAADATSTCAASAAATAAASQLWLQPGGGPDLSLAGGVRRLALSWSADSAGNASVEVSWPASDGDGDGVARASLPLDAALWSSLPDGTMFQCAVRAWTGRGAATAWMGLSAQTVAVTKDVTPPLETSVATAHATSWSRAALADAMRDGAADAAQPFPAPWEASLADRVVSRAASVRASSLFLDPTVPESPADAVEAPEMTSGGEGNATTVQWGAADACVPAGWAMAGGAMWCDPTSGIAEAWAAVAAVDARAFDAGARGVAAALWSGLGRAMPAAFDGTLDVQLSATVGQSPPFDAGSALVRGQWARAGAAGVAATLVSRPLVSVGSGNGTCASLNGALVSRAQSAATALSATPGTRLVLLVGARNGAGVASSRVLVGPTLATASASPAAIDTVWVVDGLARRAAGGEAGVVVADPALLAVSTTWQAPALAPCGGSDDAVAPLALVKLHDAVSGRQRAAALDEASAASTRQWHMDVLVDPTSVGHGALLFAQATAVWPHSGAIARGATPLALVDRAGPSLTAPAAALLRSVATPVQLFAVPAGRRLALSWASAVRSPFPARGAPPPLPAPEADPFPANESANVTNLGAGTASAAQETEVELPGLAELRERAATLTHHALVAVLAPAAATALAADAPAVQAAPAMSGLAAAEACQVLATRVRASSPTGRGVRLDAFADWVATTWPAATVWTSPPMPDAQLDVALTPPPPTSPTTPPSALWNGSMAVVTAEPGACVLVAAQATAASGRTLVLAPLAAAIVDGSLPLPPSSPPPLAVSDLGSDGVDLGALAAALSGADPGDALGEVAESLTRDPAVPALVGGNRAAAAFLALSASNATNVSVSAGDAPLVHLTTPGADGTRGMDADVDCQTSGAVLAASWALSSANATGHFAGTSSVHRFAVTAALAAADGTPQLPLLLPWTRAGAEGVAVIHGLAIPDGARAVVGVRALSAAGAVLHEAWSDGVRVQTGATGAQCTGHFPSLALASA